MSYFELMQQSAKETRERKERLWGKPSAKIIDFGNRVEKASQESPAPVPQPLPVVDPRIEQLHQIEEELERLRGENSHLQSQLRQVNAAVLAEIETADASSYPRIEKIIRAVSVYYGIPVTDLKSKRKTNKVVIPRQIAMYLCKEMTLRSYPEIGRRMGGKDHSTCIHAFRKIAERRKHDPKMDSEIEEITNIILRSMAESADV